MFFGSMDLTATAGSLTIEDDCTLFGWDVNIDINILKYQFTPLVTGGIGFINFSGDDFDETDFSYNIGIGFRWDITDHFLMKGMYRSTWTELEDTDDNVQFDGVSVALGYIF